MTPPAAIQLLVVDDDRNHREMLRALLEEWGYASIGAASGEEALELCHQRPFDLILMKTPGCSLDRTVGAVPHRVDVRVCVTCV